MKSAKASTMRAFWSTSARSCEDEALGAEPDDAALGAHVELKLRAAERRGPESQQRVATGQRHVGVLAQVGEQPLGQARRAAFDAGQLLAHRLQRPQPPD